MRIDWNRYIHQLLPISMRKERMIAILEALTWPLQQLHSELLAWVEIRRMRAACRPQVQWIERMIKLETGVDAVISDSTDYNQADFIVLCEVDAQDPAEIDRINQVKRCVDSYKMAGKRWAFQIAGVEYSCTKGGWICAGSQINYPSPIIRGWQCVRIHKDYFYMEISLASGFGIILSANSDNMPEDATVRGVVRYTYQGFTPVDMDFSIDIKKGQASSYINVYPANPNYIARIIMDAAIYPLQTQEYIYQLDINNN